MSEMIERVARAIFEVWAKDAGLAKNDRDWQEVVRVKHSIVDLARQEARAAIAAMREPTVEMVAAAFPCEHQEKFDHSAKRLGAAACLALSKGKDIGLLEGAAVEQAAFLVRDYRLMIDNALAAPPVAYRNQE